MNKEELLRKLEGFMDEIEIRAGRDGTTMDTHITEARYVPSKGEVPAYILLLM